MATHSSILAWRIPMDKEAWRTIVHGVTKSQTLSDWTELNRKQFQMSWQWSSRWGLARLALLEGPSWHVALRSPCSEASPGSPGKSQGKCGKHCSQLGPLTCPWMAPLQSLWGLRKKPRERLLRTGGVSLWPPLFIWHHDVSLPDTLSSFQASDSLSHVCYDHVPFPSVSLACVADCLLSSCLVWLVAIPWTVAPQASLSMGILQARTLEWVAMPSSRGSSQPSYWT